MSEPLPAIGISLSMDIGKGSNLVFQTHVPQLSEANYINDVLDKLRLAAVRQQSQADLEATEFQLGHDQRTLEMLSADFRRISLREEEEMNEWISSGRKGPWRRNERQEQHREKMIEQMKHMEFQIEAVKSRIEDLKKKAA